MKLTIIIALAALCLFAIGCWTCIHRYSFYPVGDGVAMYRCDHLTGNVSILNLKERQWVIISPPK